MPFQTFEEIQGQEDALARLRSGLRTGRPGHSHLFHGPKGVGKSTVARGFAQILLCKEREETGERSCGLCTGCRKVVGGQHPDLLCVEMEEGKTRISIDQIRELSAFLSLTPLESRCKVAVVDDAAFMNDAAANALLKTLEEPPAQSVLVLTTCRLGALLPTIRSRCTKTRFAGLEKEHLLAIVSSVTQTREKEIAEAVDLSGGEVGRAISLCESGILAERQLFFREIDALKPGTLGELCRMAEYWSQAARFPTVLILLKGWFQDQVRDRVIHQDDPEHVRAWLALSHKVDEILIRAVEVNLNRRLVLETLFIKLARLRGAAF